MLVPSRAPELPHARDAIRRLVPFSSLLLAINALPAHRKFESRHSLGDYPSGSEPEVALRVCLACEHIALGLLFLAQNRAAHLPCGVTSLDDSRLACAAATVATA